MKEKSKKSKTVRRIGIILFPIMNLLVVVALHRYLLLTTGILLLLSLIGFLTWRSHVSLWIFIIGAFLGPFAEMIAINHGIWSYSITNVGNVPSWLFVLWGNTALFFYYITMEFERKRFHIR